MGTRWLTEDQLAAWIRLLAVTELLPGVLDSQLRSEADLTHFEYYVLAMLSEAPGTRRIANMPRGWSAMDRCRGWWDG